jgi:hypothetical protein
VRLALLLVLASGCVDLDSLGGLYDASVDLPAAADLAVADLAVAARDFGDVDGGAVMRVAHTLIGDQYKTSMSVPLPGGLQVDDWLLLFFYVDYAPAITGDPPSGWTMLQSSSGTGGNIAVRLYARRVDGTEPPSWQFSWSGSQACSAELVAYRGVAAIDGMGRQAELNMKPYTIPSLTTTVANEQVVLFFLGDTSFGSQLTISGPAGLDPIDHGNFIAAFEALVPQPGPAPGGAVTDSDGSNLAVVLDYVGLVPQ